MILKLPHRGVATGAAKSCRPGPVPQLLAVRPKRPLGQKSKINLFGNPLEYTPNRGRRYHYGLLQAPSLPAREIPIHVAPPGKGLAFTASLDFFSFRFSMTIVCCQFGPAVSARYPYAANLAQDPAF